ARRQGGADDGAGARRRTRRHPRRRSGQRPGDRRHRAGHARWLRHGRRPGPGPARRPPVDERVRAGVDRRRGHDRHHDQVALVSDIAVDFASTYAAAFRRYLDDAGEGALEAAYELGRTALREHLTLLDLAVVHHRVLLRALADEQAAGDAASVAESAGRFFLESLSVFEMTQRGLTETRRLYGREPPTAATLH